MNCQVASLAFDPTSPETLRSEAEESITHAPHSKRTSSSRFCIGFLFVPKSHRSDTDEPWFMPVHAVGSVNRRGTLSLGILYLS